MGTCLPGRRRPHRAGADRGQQRPASSGPAGSRSASSHNTTRSAATHDDVESASTAGDHATTVTGDDTTFGDHATTGDNDPGRASIKPTGTTLADDRSAANEESDTFWGRLPGEHCGIRFVKPGYQRRKSPASWSLRTRLRT
jgi:hypothetical protein